MSDVMIVVTIFYVIGIVFTIVISGMARQDAVDSMKWRDNFPLKSELTAKKKRASLMILAAPVWPFVVTVVAARALYHVVLDAFGTDEQDKK